MLVWDDSNIAHIALHNVSPAEVEQVIANNSLDLGRQVRNGELRRMHLGEGETDTGRVLLVLLTEQKPPRTVTSYPAKERLRRFYTTQKANRYAEDP